MEDGYLSIKYKSSYEWLSKKYDQPEENKSIMANKEVKEQDPYQQELNDKLNERFNSEYSDKQLTGKISKKELKCKR